MKEVFDIRRFGRYMVYDLKNVRSTYGLTFLILSLMPVVLCLLHLIFTLIGRNSWTAPSFGARAGILIVTTIALIMSFPANCYGFVTDKKAGTSWLLLPASSFEKFLSMFLICVVLLPAAYLLLYLGSDWLLSVIDRTAGDPLVKSVFGGNGLISFNFDQEASAEPVLGPFYAVYANYALAISVFLLGAVFFKKFKVVKTILAQIAFLMLFSIALSFVITTVGGDAFRDFIMSITGSDPDTIVRRMKIYLYVAWWGAVALVSAGTFFKIKTLQH